MLVYLLFNYFVSSDFSAQKSQISSLSFCFVDSEKFPIVSLEVKFETIDFMFAFVLGSCCLHKMAPVCIFNEDS